MSDDLSVIIKMLADNGVLANTEEMWDVGLVKGYEKIIGLDFSEHDKAFEDKIEKLENINKQLEGTNKTLGERLDVLRTRCKDSAVDMFDNNCYGCLSIVTHPRENELEVRSLKQRIAELEQSRSEWIDRAVEWQQKCEKLESRETGKQTKCTAVIVAKEIDGQTYVTLDDFMSVVNDLQAKIGT